MIYLVLSGNNIQIITSSNQQTLSLPSEIIRYQEIVNRDKFAKLIQEYFSSPQKYEVGIFLNPRLVYHKAIPVKNTPPDMIKAEEEKFFNSVPIAEKASANIVIHGRSEILLLSTNKHILQTIITLFTAKDWKIRFAVPLTVFSENPQTTQFNYQQLKKFQEQKKLIKKFNFLPALAEKKSKDKISDHKRLLLFIALTFIPFLALAIILFLILNQSSNNQSKINPTATPTTTITPTLSPTLSPTATTAPTLSKREIKIQIFNGSGTTGEATNIRNRLVALGFANIEIGDAEGATSNTTIAIFSERTPTAYKEEILTELRKLFSTIETQEIAVSDSYDVFITTGTSL